MMDRDFRAEIRTAVNTSDVGALASIAMDLLAIAEATMRRREKDRRRKSAEIGGNPEIASGRGSPPDSPCLPPGPPNQTPLTPHLPQQQPRPRARDVEAVTALANRLPERVRDTVAQLARGQRNPMAWAMSMAGMLDGLGVTTAVTPEALAQALTEIAATNREPTPLSVRRFLKSSRDDAADAGSAETEAEKFLRGVA